jgi:hypothetical protein
VRPGMGRGIFAVLTEVRNAGYSIGFGPTIAL